MEPMCSQTPMGKHPLLAACSLYKMFWVFFLFSVLGAAIEGIYWILRYGHFAMRSGLIYGPFSEVYGLAAVLLIFCLYPLREKSIPVLFCAGYVIGVSFEFLASVLQQLIFGFTSWDYGNAPYAIAGRANLLFGIFWGIMAVLFIRKIYPWISALVEKVPRKLGRTVTILLVVLLTLDAAVSAAAVHRYAERKLGIPPANRIERSIDEHYTNAFLQKVYSRIGKANYN